MKKIWNRAVRANWNLEERGPKIWNRTVRPLDEPPAEAFDFPDTDIPDDIERDPGADWPIATA